MPEVESPMSTRMQRGFTLVELMVSMLIGIILMAGIVTLFISSRRSFNVDGNVAGMQDEGRFALKELARDLSMVSYVGEPLVPGSIDQDGSLDVTVDCGPDGEANWIYRFIEPGTGDLSTLAAVDNAEGADANDAFSCIDADEVFGGNDVVAIKRVAGDGIPDADVQAGESYLRSNGTVGMLYVEPADGFVGGTTRNWTYTPRIYYVRNFAVDADDGIPTLCRKTLTGAAPPTVTTECIARGVERLQIEYGLDSDADGNANRYVSDPLPADISSVVSARVYLLVRTPVEDRQYTDTRTYTVSNADEFEPGDNFHRRLYSTTLTVHNLRNLRRLGL